MTLQIRPYRERDITALLNMMRDLARFENYIDDFNVTENFLKDELTKDVAPDFGICVAEGNSQLLGYATFYPIKFTYSLSPTFVLKELFVKKEYREEKIGKHLFLKFKEIAQQNKAGQLQWSVMPSNEKAKRFYENLGGQQDMRWENWSIGI